MVLIRSMVLVLLGSATMLFGMQPAQIKRSAPSLQFTTAYSIAKKIDECEKLHEDFSKLNEGMKSYLRDLKGLIERYKIFHGNRNLQEDPTEALFCAVELGLVDIIPDLIALGADINGTRNTMNAGSITPLELAAGPYQRKIMDNRSRLVSNRPFRPGDRILVSRSNVPNSASLIDLLIKLGANIHTTAQLSGWNALHFAVSEGNITGIAALVKGGIPVNSRTEQQRTALHLAAGYVHYYMPTIMMLIGEGADVNAQDADGMTPLMEAADRCLDELARVLLSHGAKVNIVNAQGQTALGIAYNRLLETNDNKCTAVVRLLQKALAKEQ